MISTPSLHIDYNLHLFSTCAFILSLLLFSNIAHKRKLIRPELNRKIVHVFMGLLISSSALMFSSNLLPTIIGLSFIVVNLISLKINAFPGINSQERESYGTIYFPLSYSLIVLFFWEESNFVMTSLLILSISDPIAGYMGEKLGSSREFKIWYDKKTFHGTLTFFLLTIIILSLSIFYLEEYNLVQSILFILIISIFTTVSEIMSIKGSDNLSIPLISILMMIALEEKFIYQQESIVIIILMSKLILMTITLYLSLKIGALSLSGFFGASIMGCLLLLYGIPFHFILLASFFILSSCLNIFIKKLINLKTKHSQRNVVQVICNGGVPLLICIISYFHQSLFFNYLFAASVATAMSDTWATEFGKLSKVRPITIASLKKVSHGLSGGVTFIGTIGSLIGSCIIGFLAYNLISVEKYLIFGIILCGFLGSIFDSILGDKLQGKYKTISGKIIEKPENNSIIISGHGLINNDVVNLIATFSGPLFMYLYIRII